MRKHFLLSLFALCITSIIVSCGGKSDQSEPIDNGESTEQATQSTPEADNGVDLSNKGIGPVSSVTLNEEIDQEMAKKGDEIFKSKCTACHKPDVKHIGPAPKGILERRAPEWVMNMILNPDEMIQKDPIAKQLLMEFNGSPMANQSLKEEEARAVLEYFRTL